MKKCILITNPLSGSYNDKKINKMVKELQKSGLDILRYDLEKDEKISSVISNIDSNDIQHIILAFGDGTINSACNALMNRDDYNKFIISVLPMGTANILAMELNCDTIKKSIKAIKNNNITKIHIAKINDKYFTLMASTGFDSWTVRNINEDLKKRIGKLAYIYEFLKIVAKRNFKRIITNVNGEIIENILTCASNGKYYGIKIPVTHSKLSKNLFDVVVIKKFSLLSALQYMITKKTNKDIVYLQSNKVVISSDVQDYPVQIDGDYCCDLPIVVEATDRFLNFTVCG